MAKATLSARLWRTLTAVGLTAVVIAGSFEPVDAGNRSFKLLKIKRQLAKWYGPAHGAPVELKYAFIDRPMRFAAARNCGSLQPIGAALMPSKIAFETFRSEARKAFQLWEAVAEVRFTETRDVKRANIFIGAQTSPRGRAFTDVKIDNRRKHMVPRAIERSLICFNPEVRWKVGYDGNLDVYDLSYTMAHEIGHVLGLDHPGAAGQVMGYRYDEQHTSLQTGDIDGILKLYNPTRNAATVRRRAEFEAKRRTQQKRAQIPAPSDVSRSRSLGLGTAEAGH